MSVEKVILFEERLAAVVSLARLADFGVRYVLALAAAELLPGPLRPGQVAHIVRIRLQHAVVTVLEIQLRQLLRRGEAWEHCEGEERRTVERQEVPTPSCLGLGLCSG